MINENILMKSTSHFRETENQYYWVTSLLKHHNNKVKR